MLSAVSCGQREPTLDNTLMSLFTNGPTTTSSDARATTGVAPSGRGQPDSSAAHTGVQQDGETPLFEKLCRGATSPLRLLPDFLVIGTQRGGTTSLFHYLQAHSAIAPSSIKEIHFFDRRYHKGLTWYRGHFPTSAEKFYAQHLRGKAFVTGEASPAYLFHPRVPRRVRQALPSAKLIVLLRNPVDRAYSQYFHAREHGFETLPFEEAITGEVERTAREREHILRDEHYESYEFKHRSYLSRGIYVEQLQAWMSLFPAEQFLILKSEDFYADPAASVKQVLAFLNLSVDEMWLKKQDYRQYNTTTHSTMDAGLRRRLTGYFEPHNARLYDFLGIDFGWEA